MREQFVVHRLVFSVLSLAATREVLEAFFHRQWDKFFLAGVLFLLVVNDALFSGAFLKEAPTGQRRKNWWLMELSDLASFLLLVISLVLLSPDTNIFRVDVPKEHFPDNPHCWIWLLILVYWAVSMGWNWLADAYRGFTRWQKRMPFLLFLPFLLTFVASACWPKGTLTAGLGFLSFVSAAAYLIIKGYIVGGLPGRETDSAVATAPDKGRGEARSAENSAEGR
jgi:hypothetical protein